MAEATTYWNGLTRQGKILLQVNTDSATFPAYIGIIAAAEGLPSNYYILSLERDSRFNSVDYPTEFFVDIETDLGIPRLVNGDVFVATPIQHGLTKELRQKQKLDIAAATRAADSNSRSTYDITQLPTQFNNNDIVDNPNIGGLVQGRPWIDTTTPFTFYEAFGTTTAISTTQYVSGNKIYAESSTYDVPSYQPARVVVNDIQVVNTELRGHTLVVLDTYGDVVTPATRYDTYIDSANLTALASALNAVSSGNIVVLVSYDATALNAGVRSAINTGYGSTNTNTWAASRVSHIFIGVKI